MAASFNDFVSLRAQNPTHVAPQTGQGEKQQQEMALNISYFVPCECMCTPSMADITSVRYTQCENQSNH